MPKISIIVPVYNVEKYLRQCLDSILNQIFTDWECILIDDGSPDNSGKICDEYAEKDSRFRVIHQENKGVSVARNAGLDVAQGEWISFVDSDDWVERETYEKVLDAAEKSDGDLVCFNIKYVSSNGKHKKIKFKDKGLENNFIFYPVIMHSLCNKVVNKKLFFEHKVKFDSSLVVCEDLDVSFRLLFYASKTVYIDEYFYNYRNNGESVCNTPITQRKIDDTYKVYLKLKDFLCVQNREKEFNKFLRFRNLSATMTYLVNPLFFNIKTFRKLTLRYNFWIYSLRPDYFILTLSVHFHIDFISKIYIYLKYLNVSGGGVEKDSNFCFLESVCSREAA